MSPSQVPRGNTRAAAPIFCAVLAGGLCGSVLTAAVVLLGAVAVADLLRGRLELRLTLLDRWLAAALAAYAGVQVLAAVLHPMPEARWSVLVPLALFPLVWLVIPWLRAQGLPLFGTFTRAASWSTLLVLPLALYQAFWLGGRAEGFSGNALPFAQVSALLSVASLLRVRSPDARDHAPGWAGFAAGAACIALSGSRALLPVPFLALVALLACRMEPRRGEAFRRDRRHLAGGALVALSLLVAVWQSPVTGRVSAVLADIVRSGPGGIADQSLSHRLALWKAGWRLFLEKPLLGHGMINRPAEIAGLGYDYTHFHNGFVTVAVDAGVPGLLVLLAVLSTPLLIGRRVPAWDRDHARKRFFGAAIAAIYAYGGLTNLIFGQDIYDGLFVFTTVLLAASIPAGAGNPVVIGWKEDC